MRSVKTAVRRGAVAAVLLAAGCATTRQAQDLPAWPLPPDKPRVRFVRAFQTEEQLSQGAWASITRAVIPPSQNAIVKQPTGLALSPDEKVLYVTCSSTSTILRADLEKGKLDVFGSAAGPRPARPFGIAVDANGNVYVSDSAANTVVVYGADGKHLRNIAHERLDKPTGIAIDRRGQVLYVVAGVHVKSREHRVEAFSLAGKHLRTIGTRGDKGGEFNFPTNMTVAKDGTLYVVDMLNFRVQLFDTEGRLVSMFGMLGAGQPGTFDKAKSVALDTFGNVYVVDSQAAHVQMFNPKFQVLMAFGGKLNKPGHFLTPTAIAIDSKNTIYVAEFFGGWVAQYELVNTTAADGYAADGTPPPTSAAAGK